MWGPIAGRICLIQGGSNTGQPGFIAQCWDTFDDTPNNVDGDGIQYSSKLDWWNSCEYSYVWVRNLLFSGQPHTLVKVVLNLSVVLATMYGHQIISQVHHHLEV